MSLYSVAILSDRALVDTAVALLDAGHRTTALLLAHLAEIEARGLHAPAGYASMYAYCVGALRMSEDAALKRIRAARAARRFPALFDAIAEARLHLSAVVLLAPHLTEENVDALIAAATHRSKAAIAVLLAERFPRPDLPTTLRPEPTPTPPSPELVPGQLVPGPVAGPVARLTPLAPQRVALQVTLAGETHDKLVRAQALLRHRLPSGDIAAVLDHALEALLATLEKQKFAKTDRPRPAAAARAARRGHRRVPNAVKRAVHARDGERCAFVSADGVRCGETGFLEYDHIDPVALGGASTVAGVRLLCATHNRHEAQRRLGAASMPAKPAAAAPPPPPWPAPAPDFDAEVLLGLRGLDVKLADARQALAASAPVPAATLEERMRAALAALRTLYVRRCTEDGPVWRTAG